MRETGPEPGERIERREVVENTGRGTAYDPAPGERVERHEVVERGGVHETYSSRRSTPMWAWVLPLVVVVAALAWFIVSRGEPRSPIADLPDIEMEPAAEETRIIEVPTVDIDAPPDVDVVIPPRSSPAPESAPATEAAPSAEAPR